MPAKNVIKFYDSDSYYHVYNRGVNKRVIFLDDEDYAMFIRLLKRLLDPHASKDKAARSRPYYGDEAELLAFCLMPNHFHMLWYQHPQDAITKIMRSICTAYVMYFNKKYNRVGPLFQQRFRASPILDDAYLLHISRYIHLNPGEYTQWQWSSLPYYTAGGHASWVSTGRILRLFGSPSEYVQFIAAYKARRDELQLAKTNA